MKKQNGFVHALLILGLVLIVGGALSVVFLHNFVKRQPASMALKPAASGTTTRQAKPEAVRYKTYTSFSGSGLTFDYPDTWWFEPPTKQPNWSGGRKSTVFLLFSEQPSVVNGRPETANDSMCVTFNEMQGSWPFRSQAPSNTETVANFVVGQSKVSLVANKDSTGYANMQLINHDPSSEHGAAYVKLNDGYFVLATAQKNCYPNDRPEQKDLSTEIEQTKTILKSVRIAN